VAENPIIWQPEDEQVRESRLRSFVGLAVRFVVHWEPVENTHALANPDALAHYRAIAELQND